MKEKTHRDKQRMFKIFSLTNPIMQYLGASYFFQQVRACYFLLNKIQIFKALTMESSFVAMTRSHFLKQKVFLFLSQTKYSFSIDINHLTKLLSIIS